MCAEWGVYTHMENLFDPLALGECSVYTPPTGHWPEST
jgi:hypothetical protein